MKNIKILAILSLSILLWSCDKDNDMTKETQGTVTLNFDNVAGEADLTLAVDGSTEYPYSNANDQAFNVRMMGYYISKIKLTGDNLMYEDEAYADTEISKGYYHVQESVSGSAMIELADVPSGSYSQITFTLGIDGSTVQEGALGGVLNPENGAWFWNWNVGYIAFALEGSAEDAGSENKQIAFHIGGWGDPNNIKEISLDLPTALVVGDQTSSMAHIKVDALKTFTGHMNVDFASTFSVHSPAAGEHIAYNVADAFYAHHVMNNQ
ncbi:MAG: hypothetical protein RIC35_04460 [Marinoscillum sp.]